MVASSYCTICCTWNPSYNGYCFNCGTPLPKPPTVVGGTCPKCGNVNPAYAHHCGVCGRRLGSFA